MNTSKHRGKPHPPADTTKESNQLPRNRPDRDLVESALRLGFSVGISEMEAIDREDRLSQWLGRGFHGEMGFMERTRALRQDPGKLMGGGGSVISLALPYGPVSNRVHHPAGTPGLTAPASPPQPGPAPDRFPIARYAQGRDYHQVIEKKLALLLDLLHRDAPDHTHRGWCDRGPVLEKAWAVRAGLGKWGYSSLLQHPIYGTGVFLAAIITTMPMEPAGPFFPLPDPAALPPTATTKGGTPATHTEDGGLPPGEPHTHGGCINCNRCIQACPARAIVAPGVIDARRCIAYLTIEHKGVIPRELRPPVGDRVFGCDTCQTVCPSNKGAGARFKTAPWPIHPALKPIQGHTHLTARHLSMARAEFTEEFANTPLHRTGLTRLKRNILICMGNGTNKEEHLPLAIGALLEGEDPLIRLHGAWAVCRLGGMESRAPLLQALETEQDPQVTEEIKWALNHLEQTNQGPPPLTQNPDTGADAH